MLQDATFLNTSLSVLTLRYILHVHENRCSLWKCASQ